MPKKRVLRHARTWVAAVTALVTAPLLVAGVGVSSAQADDLPYLAWTAYLPSWTDQYVPSSDNDCVAGRPSCLKATLKKFGTILKENAQSCTHEAVFAMTYTRITQTYGYVRDIPGYFQDVPYINHMDAVFAKYYFDAYDNYQSGNRAAVPAAWQTAFDAARDRRMTGTGDLLLGINAHVNRDLPFVLASMGIVRPDGQSGKPDFDKADLFLNDASDALMAELSQALRPHHRRRQRPAGAQLRVGDAAAHDLARGRLAQRRGTGQRAERRCSSARRPGHRERRERGREHDPAVAGLHAAADHHDCARRLLRRAQGRHGTRRLPVRDAHAVRRLTDRRAHTS